MNLPRLAVKSCRPLEALGLVKRHTDPKDRRVWRLRLTSAAAPVLRDAKRGRAKLHDIMTKEYRSRRLARHAQRSAPDEGEHRQQPGRRSLSSAIRLRSAFTRQRESVRLKLLCPTRR